MHRLLLVLLFACGDKTPPGATPPTPGTGAPPAIVDAPPEPVTKFPLRALSGKPPHKTTHPVTRGGLEKLSAIAVPDFAVKVRKLDEGFLDLELARPQPPLRVMVTIQPCLRCLPMKLDQWQAETDALRIVIPPDLRDRSDTAFEVAQVALAGAPVIATYQLGFADPTSTSHAITLYHADGINQIRVTAAYAGATDTREALTSVTRADLTQVALAVLDVYVQGW